MTNEEYRAEYDNICQHLREHDDHIEISVSWGDWKHSHAYLDYLMKELGYVKDDEELTEEDGSDCYSSIHFYNRS